jgi:enoyl-CoA hydratase/carnithine racemase
MKTDFQTIGVEIQDGVAVLTLNNPPVNQMSPPFMMELAAAIESAYEDEAVKAIVLTGTGRNFIAGADITQVQKVKTIDDIYPGALMAARWLNRLEEGPKPIVAALNGNTLGGGLETAMACHYRVAIKGINLGQPEVQIGLIPGAGGTQRLPRLIGLPNALEMITIGAPIKSEKAFQRGLVDELVEPDQLIPTAVAAAKKFINRTFNLKGRMTRNMHTRLPSASEKKNLLDFTKMMTASKAKGYIAPFKAIQAIEEGLSFDMVKDIEREVELFAECAISDVAKNLIGIFLNTRAAGRLPRIKDLTPAPIKKVAMLGGGVMGSGIVHLLLKGGYQTVLWDINDAALEKGVASVRKTFGYAIKKKEDEAGRPGSHDREPTDFDHEAGRLSGRGSDHRGGA